MQRKECVTITMRKFRYILLIVMILCSVMTVFARAENGSGFTLEEMEAKFHEAEKEAAYWCSYGGDLENEADEHSNPTQEQLTNAGYTARRDTPREYWQVIGTNSLAEIRKKLGVYFTQDVVDRLMADKEEFRNYFECDGKLYWHADADLHPYDCGEYEFKITSQTKNKVVLHLDFYKSYYPYESGDTKFVGEYDYIYEKQEDGTWKFATYKAPMCGNYYNKSLFSEYVYKQVNPQTGDNGITVAIALCAVSAAVAFACKKRKIRV